MFRDAHSFNQPLNKWNVSNVTDVFGMFWRLTTALIKVIVVFFTIIIIFERLSHAVVPFMIHGVPRAGE